MSSKDDGNVVRLRGLPWSATREEIATFLGPVNIVGGPALGVHLTTTREGRATGEAYVELDTEEDVEKAITKNKEHLGSRYIEVFKASRSEMDWVINKIQKTSFDDFCVRLRGLPFGATKEDLIEFFQGLPIIPNGISLPLDAQGRASGDAYVQFTTSEAVDKALEKHKEKIGHRYIEVFRCSIDEMNTATAPRGMLGGMRAGRGGAGGGRPTPYDRAGAVGGMRTGGYAGGYGADYDDMSGGGYGFGGTPSGFGGFGGGNTYADYGGFGGRMGGAVSGGMGRMGGMSGGMGATGSGSFRIQMRGLPFKATEGDIAAFFRPIRPVYINIDYNDKGKPSGEAYVEFQSYEEAMRAMSLDKTNMQHRYIELFMDNGAPGAGGAGRFGADKKFTGPVRR